jgi:hypothetical protein
MASSSDLTEIRRYLTSNGLCANCSNGQGQDCTTLYQMVNSKMQSGALSSTDLTEIKRLILSNLPCTLCIGSQGTPNVPG